MSSIDSSELLEEARGESDKIRISLYVSKSIYKEFKSCLENISASKMVQKMMRDFVKDRKSKQLSKSNHLSAAEPSTIPLRKKKPTAQ